MTSSVSFPPIHLGKLIKGEEENNRNNKVTIVDDHREINIQRARALETTDPNVLEQLRKEEKLKRQGETDMQNFISYAVEEELKYSRINRLKLISDWRVIMRIAKIDELRKLIEIYFQNFERDLDNKDAILQMLDKDIEEAEEHYTIALRNHFIHIKQLSSLQDSRISGLFKEFYADVEELEREFEKETVQIMQNFNEEKQEIFNMMLVINDEYEAKRNKIDTESRSFLTDLKNKIGDKYVKLQDKIKKAADSEVTKFTNEINDIKAKSKENSKKDDENIGKLKDFEKSIDIQKKKVDKFTEQNKQIKLKIKQNQEDWDLKNGSLKDEKDKIMESYKILKRKMIEFRNGQREKLKKLVKNSWDCKLKLESYIKLSEKILKLAEICRTLETEKEKILPFYENSDEANQEDIPVPEVDKIEGINPEFYDEVESLQQFWKRYNKVKLDVIAIKRQKSEYMKQNEILRTLLQQYYDGFTVNHVVMSNENPLLRIERAGDYNHPAEENTGKTLQEAGVIYSEVYKQRHFNR